MYSTKFKNKHNNIYNTLYCKFHITTVDLHRILSLIFAELFQSQTMVVTDEWVVQTRMFVDIPVY